MPVYHRILTAIAAVLMASSLRAENLVLDNVRLVDVATGTLSEPQTVYVEDGWFVSALGADGGNANDGSSDEKVRRINGEGGYLLPGLAEMHAHVPPASESQRVDDLLQLFLAHGVTTVRGMLGEPGHLLLRSQLARGERLGPRLVTSGPSINGNSAPTARDARALVLEQQEAGYDFLKLHPGLVPETFDAMVGAANGLGISFAGHVADGVGLMRALNAGQATIDHLDAYAQLLVPSDHPLHGADPGFFGVRLAAALNEARIPELAEKTREAGVMNVPTQTLIENLGVNDLEALEARSAMRYMPADTRARWRASAEKMRADYSADELERFVAVRRALMRALHREGAGLLLGSDAPQIMNVPGDSLHHELEILVDIGLTPAEALATGTVNVARFFGKPALGCLQPGCVADAVLLTSDPLADIAAVREIRAVMRAGQWLDRARLDAMLEAIAERAGS